MTVDLVTTSGIFDYSFAGSSHQTSDGTLGEMSYSNAPIRNCVFGGLGITFSFTEPEPLVTWNVILFLVFSTG